MLSIIDSEWTWIDCGEGVEIRVANDYVYRDGIRAALKPSEAQQEADLFGAMLPTPQMVRRIRQHPDAIHVPFKSMRPVVGESITCVRLVREHHAYIEGALAGRSGLVVDCKKDIVVCRRLEKRPLKVHIYGAWYKNAVKPVQPLCDVHSNKYADYSHGARLVSLDCRLNGAPAKLTQVLAGLHGSPATWAVSDEGAIDPAHLRYRT